MADPTISEKPSLESKQPFDQWLRDWTAKGIGRTVAWAIVWTIVGGLVGFAATAVGRYVGGESDEIGMWLGWVPFVLVMFAICAIVGRLCKHYTITITCLACTIIAISRIAEEAARHYGAEKWTWLVGLLTAIVMVYPLAFTMRIPLSPQRQE